jgi:hypothetical protein
MHLAISRPQKKNHSPVGRRPPHLPAQLALSSAYMVKNAFYFFYFKKNGFGLRQDLTIIGV